MNSAKIQPSVAGIADVLRSIRNKGVRLWAEGGQLRYKAPPGALTQEEIDRLRIYKRQIIELLENKEGAQTAGRRHELRRWPDRAPLAFSQLAHWHLYELRERHAIRQIASASRLRGRLNVDALQRSVAEVVRRHDALRTRIVVHDGVPMQEVSKSGSGQLSLVDLTASPEAFREAEVIRLIEQLIMEPIDVAVGPLFIARLLRLGDDEHVLVIAMEHMISDEVSINIFLRELFTAYTLTLTSREWSLPPITMQFSEYAAWQRNAQRTGEHGAYWNERLMGCQRLRFPEDKIPPTPSSGWGTVPIRIGRDLKAELREWCRLKRTTLAMSVFTAYVGLVLRWCNVSECVVRYQSDGRVSPSIENTIGYFASALYLPIRLVDGDSFVDLLRRVTEEYCKSYEHADFSYLAAQVPRPEFTRNTGFNWVPQASEIDLSSLDVSEHSIRCSAVRFAHPMLKHSSTDSEPTLLLYDSGTEIVGDVLFPLNRFSVESIERLTRNFLVMIMTLLRKPDESVNDVLLV